MSINMTFGPDKAWALWIEDNPRDGEPPHYRTSSKLPTGLESRMFGRSADIQVLHSLTFGVNGTYAVSFYSADTKQFESLWHLKGDYPRLDGALINTHEHEMITSLGTDGNFFFNPKVKPIRVSSINNPECEDEAYAEGKGIKFITFGREDCAIMVTKEGQICKFGPVDTVYSTLTQDITYQESHGGNGKVVSAALNPYTKDEEYFIAFEDGTCYYKAAFLGPACRRVPSPNDGNYLPSPIALDSRVGYAVWEVVDAWSRMKRTPPVEQRSLVNCLRPTRGTDLFQTPPVLTKRAPYPPRPGVIAPRSPRQYLWGPRC